MQGVCTRAPTQYVHIYACVHACAQIMRGEAAISSCLSRENYLKLLPRKSIFKPANISRTQCYKTMNTEKCKNKAWSL